MIKDSNAPGSRIEMPHEWHRGKGEYAQDPTTAHNSFPEPFHSRFWQARSGRWLFHLVNRRQRLANCASCQPWF
jgi:hypothetical protein